MPNFGQKFPSAQAGASRPLASIFRRHLAFLPLIGALGFLATALEGIGIGLLIPLLALLLGNTVPDGLPRPIEAAADFVLSLNTESRILALGIAIVGLVILKGVVQTANGWLVAIVEGRIGKDIRDSLAARLLALDYPFFLENDRARLSRILSMDSGEVVVAVRSALTLIPATVGLFVLSALLAWLNLKLFLIALAGAAVVQLVLLAIERRQRQLSLKVTEADLALWERMLSLVAATRVIRLFGQQRIEQERFAGDSERMRSAVQSSRTLLATVNPAIDGIVALLFVAILLGGTAIGMTIPAITAFLVLLSRAQPHAYAISNSRLGIAALHGPLKEVEWLLSQQPAKTGKPRVSTAPKLDRPIVFDRVSFAFPDGSEALNNASFAIKPGVATALIGRSGSGKTTIVNLLCRLIEPQAGRIRLGDLSAETIEPDQWRAGIAVAGQDVELVDATISENIAYGRSEATADEIESAARAAGAADFIARLPAGYETRVAGQGLNLSGGERQRIGLARALLRRPDLLILDEATNAVDALSESEIMKLIREHRYFGTVLVISHRKSTLASCDEGIVVDEGVVRETGPLSKLAYFKTMAGDSQAYG